MQTEVPAPFVPFGGDHVLALASIAAAAIALPLATRHLGTGRAERVFAAAFAAVLVGHELFKIWVRVDLFQQSLGESLPLHLCNIASFVLAYVLVRRSRPGFEVVYFWGLCASLPALLTPDLAYGFPSVLFFTFFFGHGLVIAGVIYAAIQYRFRLTLGSVARAIGVTVVYAALIAPLNYLLDANYLFLRHKPEQATVIDLLGPWPWYIPSLALIGVIACLVFYLPFAFLAWRSGRRRDPGGPADA